MLRAQSLSLPSWRVRALIIAVLTRVYGLMKRSRLVHLAPVRWLRGRIVVGMRPVDVLDVMTILDRGGAPCWLVGGWGVDALVGRQTREHDDVDLATERRFLRPAVQALRDAGFEVVQEETTLPAWMPTITILRDARGRSVELMGVDVPEPPAGQDDRPEGMRFRYEADSFATGTVGGRPVPCLAPDVQLRFHSRYAPRDSDRHDVRVLVEHFDFAAPEGFS